MNDKKTKIIVALIMLTGIIWVTFSAQTSQAPELEDGVRSIVIGSPEQQSLFVIHESLDQQSSRTVRIHGEYMVKQGDNLYRIAKSFGLRVGELKFANPQLSGDELIVGQVLYIPTID